ncbi:hypothetical protein [Sodalis sp. RH16]
MYSGLDGSFTAVFVVFFIISAVVGWAMIEGLIWFFHHLSFVWS